MDVKLALERRFREPLDVKLALERRFSGALGRQVGLGFGAKAGRAGKAGVEGVLKGLFESFKPLGSDQTRSLWRKHWSRYVCMHVCVYACIDACMHI